VLLSSLSSTYFFPVRLPKVYCHGFNSSPMCPVIFCRHVLFGFSRDELRATPRIFVYILNLCKFTIWQSRNDYRFRGIPPDAVSAIVKVKTRVNFNLPLFFKRFRSARRQRYFHRQWGARCLRCSWPAISKYIMFSLIIVACPLVLGLLSWCTVLRLVSVSFLYCSVRLVWVVMLLVCDCTLGWWVGIF